MARVVSKIFHWFFLSCKEATFLIEKQLDGRLSFVERMQLKGHLFFCKICVAYNKKAKILHKILQNYIRKDFQHKSESCEMEKFKYSLKEKINNFNT